MHFVSIMEEGQSNQAQNNYELKKQQKLEEEKILRRQKTIRKIIKTIFTSVLMIVSAGGLIWYAATRPQTEEVADVTKQCVVHGKLGMHIHPVLRIVINGEEKIIPANIGIPSSSCMRPMHTHDKTGTIHIESKKIRSFQLKEFFAIWGKEFNSNCILDSCSGPAGKVRMFVNENENAEFENYQMKDKDKIEIKFE